MIQLTFDADAGTLYWYFTEIAAGSVATEAEAASTLLLDDAGQVIGVELELAADVTVEDLTLALRQPLTTYDRASGMLTVLLFAEEPVEVRPLDELAVLDLDAAGSILGCELFPAPEFAIAERLERLAPFIVDADAEDDEDDQLLEETRRQGDEETRRPGEGEAESDGEAVRSMHAPAVVPAPLPEGYRSGFVAIVGRPNVGKSTLLNALLGEKVAIVSPKPQTTRMPVRGILTRPDAQVIFVDTPGIHSPKNRLGTIMVEHARRAIPDADVVCFMVDITMPPGRLDEEIAALVRHTRAPRVLVLNKIDRPHHDGQDHLEAYRALGPWDMEVAVSALRREGLETLLGVLIERLPLGGRLYLDDRVTDQSTRERAAELVREQVLRLTNQEVPHGVAVEVEEWLEKDEATYIRMTIYVEKESQKGIIIGARGAMLKEIGSRARREIEVLIGRQAYLDLWVKARPNWRDDPSSLGWLGYQ